MSVRCERNESWSRVTEKGSDIPPGCEVSRVESVDVCNARTPKGWKFTRGENERDCKREIRVPNGAMSAWRRVLAKPWRTFWNLGGKRDMGFLCAEGRNSKTSSLHLV